MAIYKKQLRESNLRMLALHNYSILAQLLAF